MKSFHLFFTLVILISCKNKEKQELVVSEKIKVPTLTLEQANRLIELPLHCISTEYPNKLGQTIGNDSDLNHQKNYTRLFMVVLIGTLRCTVIGV